MCVKEVVIIVSHHIKWVTTSWTYSSNEITDKQTNNILDRKTKNLPKITFWLNKKKLCAKSCVIGQKKPLHREWVTEWREKKYIKKLRSYKNCPDMNVIFYAFFWDPNLVYIRGIINIWNAPLNPTITIDLILKGCVTKRVKKSTKKQSKFNKAHSLWVYTV